MQARMSSVFGWTLLIGLMMVLAAPARASGPMFDGLVLVDEINCGDPDDPHYFTQSGGNSRIETILGRDCRVMPPGSRARYFAYRVGAGKGLEAGKAYILTVDYPEDTPRAMFITNAGCETTEGFFSGNTLGDALSPPYVTPNNESLSLPLSGQWETWQQFFHLHDRFFQTRETGSRSDRPDDGFMVIIAEFEQSDEPTSAGAAVSHLRLYEAPSPEQYTMEVELPPGDLPRRHLFWREEMSDSAVSDSQAAVSVDTDWFEYKARLMKFLGMNTFSKDLLEFGHNQGWDSAQGGISVEELPPGYSSWQAGSAWYNTSSSSNRWANMITMLENYDLDVMPFYEYGGSIGQVVGVSIGNERRCRPLGDTNGNNNYTHITWSEKMNCDVTDPDFHEDVRKLLQFTIVDFKEQKDFVGAWFRTRPSFWPISFADAALARFAEEANGGVPVTRAELQADQMLYDSYIAWWNLERKAYLEYIRDYLRSEIGDDAVVLFTWDSTEPGKNRLWENPSVVTDDPSTWAPIVGANKCMTLDEAVATHHQYEMMTRPSITWDYWEWHHANPAPDPWNYWDVDGIMLTHTYSKGYSVADPYSLEQFRAGGGLAIIRHYNLNENAMPESLVGYFVSDTNRAGPYTMLGEAWAVANGDPYYIGYLASSSYNRGFPQYVRNFNAAFLALPALPSEVLEGAADHPDVVVRAIDAGQHGMYLAVVNTGLEPADDVEIALPIDAPVVEDVVGDRWLRPVNGRVTVSLYPCQLMTLRTDAVYGFGAKGAEPEFVSGPLMIKGPGTGLVVPPADPDDPDAPDVGMIVVQGTTEDSKLIIGGRDGLVVGEIIVEGGSLASIDGRNAFVQGDISAAAGSIGQVTLAGVSDGTLTIGAAASDGGAMDLSFGLVSDYSIDSAMPIGTLMCDEWVDNDGEADTVNAPWMGSLRTKMRKANPRRGYAGSSGDFRADLNLGANPGGISLGSAAIAGRLFESRVLCTGGVGNFVTGSMNDSDLYAGVAPGVTGLPTLADIYTPASVGGAPASIDSFTIKGLMPDGYYIDNFENANVAAYAIGKVKLANAALDAADPFGLAAYRCSGITYSDRDQDNSWTWPARTGDTAACGTALTVTLALEDIDGFSPKERVASDAAGDGNYDFSDITEVYARVLGDWVYIGIATAQPIDQPGADQLVFDVSLDLAPDYWTLLSQEDSITDCLVSYDRDADRVSAYFGGGVWTPEDGTEATAAGAQAIVTESGVIICLPLDALGSYEYIKVYKTSLFQGGDSLVDVAQ